jgi:hypothetical protein
MQSKNINEINDLQVLNSQNDALSSAIFDSQFYRNPLICLAWISTHHHSDNAAG